MQADSTLPMAQRRNYKNAFHALYRIIADEGVLALWKGAGPIVGRALGLNMGMLASYDLSVEFLKDSLGFGEAATVLGSMLVPERAGSCLRKHLQGELVLGISIQKLWIYRFIGLS